MGPHEHLTRAARLFEIQGAGPRLLPLEGLRGFSALLVFFTHLQSTFGAVAAATALAAPLRFLSNLGHSGVDIFFVLSGFVIYGPLITRPTPYFRFVRRRIVRLYPVFIAVFAGHLAAGLFVPSLSKLAGSTLDRALYLIANFLMLPGVLPIIPIITVAWSLSYELFFYLSLPLLIRVLAMNRWRPWARLAFWAGVVPCFAILPYYRSVPQPRFVLFGAGILAYEIVALRPRGVRALPGAAAAVFTLSMILRGLLDPVSATSTTSPLADGRAVAFVCLLTGALLLLVAVGVSSGWLARLFSFAPLRYFGNFSYSYYLTHGAALFALGRLYGALRLPASLPAPLFLLLAIFSFAITTAVAVALFLAVEKPLSLSPRLPSTPGK